MMSRVDFDKQKFQEELQRKKEEEMGTSTCCGYPPYGATDLCSSCYEHADFEVEEASDGFTIEEEDTNNTDYLTDPEWVRKNMR